MATSEDLEQYLGKWVNITFRGELPNDHMEFTTEAMMRMNQGDKFWFTPSFRSKFIFELFIEPSRIMAIDLADREAR